MKKIARVSVYTNKIRINALAISLIDKPMLVFIHAGKYRDFS